MEKLLVGVPLPDKGATVNDLPWKKNPTIIVVGKRGTDKLQVKNE